LKAFGFTVCSLGFLVASLALAGCGREGMQSQSPMAPVGGTARTETGEPIVLAPQQVTKQSSDAEWISSSTTIPGHSLQTVRLPCPKPYRAVMSGGAYMPLPSAQSSQVFISSVQSFPTKKYNGWIAYVLNEYGMVMNLTVYALCSRV
jgi:hypothetical protein